VKCHVELAAWIDTTEPVTKGDIDRLAETFKVYLEACKGLPEMDYTIHGNSACITAFSSPGKSQELVTKLLYIKKVITDCLDEAGMKVPEI